MNEIVEFKLENVGQRLMTLATLSLASVSWSCFLCNLKKITKKLPHFELPGSVRCDHLDAAPFDKVRQLEASELLLSVFIAIPVKLPNK
jgi:hypothetical protein